MREGIDNIISQASMLTVLRTPLLSRNALSSPLLMVSSASDLRYDDNMKPNIIPF